MSPRCECGARNSDEKRLLSNGDSTFIRAVSRRVTSCSRLWSSVSSSSSTLFLTPGSSRHSVTACVSEMDRRGEDGRPSLLGGSGRGKLWTLVMEHVWDKEWGCGKGGRGGRGLHAGGAEGAGNTGGSSHTETPSERAWRRISMSWAASLYCW